jgi:hypothetical protein
MSADDATARRLDEHLDELIANGGTLPPELGGDEVAQVAHLFLVDAANLEMENERAVRRQLLEVIALDSQRGAAMRPRIKFRFFRMWQVRRVAITAMCALVACTAVAVADTKQRGRREHAGARLQELRAKAGGLPDVSLSGRCAFHCDGERESGRQRRGAQKDRDPRGPAGSYDRNQARGSCDSQIGRPRPCEP